MVSDSSSNEPASRQDLLLKSLPSRRSILKGLSAAAILSTIPLAKSSQAQELSTQQDVIAVAGNSGATSVKRRNEAYQIRIDAANQERRIPIPAHPNNGDESRYPNFIGNFSKGLPHDTDGEVDPGAYHRLLAAVDSGIPSDFDAIPLGGTVKLVDPQAGLAFDLEGTDCGQCSIPPFPALATPEAGAQAIEIYWLALLRDLPFSRYDTDSAAAAVAELDSLGPAFNGPKIGGHVTSQSLFRGFSAGDLSGPYISQFFYLPFNFGGALPLVQQYKTELPLSSGGADYLTDERSYFNARNGIGPFGTPRFDSTYRFIRSGRDLAAWVHADVLYQAYFTAALALLTMGAPFNPANPYGRNNPSAINQVGFGTFGAPFVQGLLGEVAIRALKAEWHQKWFVHRTLRPEEFGGLVHLTHKGTKDYPLDNNVLSSNAVAEAFSRNGTALMPVDYPEGCPQHPSYASGHATVAGACVTVLKWFFDESFVLPNPVVASDDGLTLDPYSGPDAGQLTVGGELNKIASNVAMARNFAGIHWRNDAEHGMLLGEAIAISVLQDQVRCYNESFGGGTFTKFDGTQITI